MALKQALQDMWFPAAGRANAGAVLLAPASWIFRFLVALRRRAYRRGWLKRERLPVPVVVVGNLTVGGSGKTPLTIWLAGELARRGVAVGVVSRGYGGTLHGVAEVRVDSDPAQVGDEPVLIAQRAACPVWVGRDRAAAARALLAAHPACQLIICDDGLQHYRLARDFEIVAMDGRGVGNGRLLPAGPLREPLARLNEADAWVVQGAGLPAGVPPGFGPLRFAMRLSGARLRNVADPSRMAMPADFAGQVVHAVAGFGDPSRFFRQLRELGLDIEAHPFPDHHAYAAQDLHFGRSAAVLMTEKDAVKCRSFADPEFWALPVEAAVEPDLASAILEKING